MKVSIKGIAVILNSQMTRFMRAADLFESFKALGHIINLNYEIEEEKISSGEVYIVIGQTAMKKQFGEKLIFGYITHVEFNEEKYDNKIMLPIWSKEISCVSDGVKNFLLVDMIKSFPELAYEEGLVRRINNIKFK